MSQPFSIILSSKEKNDISKAARIYNDYLLNKSINILAYVNNEKTIYSTKNQAENFAHLVGLSSIPRKNNATEIFYKALNKKLKSNDVLCTRGRKLMHKKLEVFKYIENLYERTLTVGKLNPQLDTELVSDLLIGYKNMVISIVKAKEDELFVINSLLNKDIRTLLEPSSNKQIELCCWQDFNKDNTLHVSMIDDRLSGKRMNDIVQFLKDFNLINYSEDISPEITHYIEEEIKSQKLSTGKDMFFIEKISLDEEIESARESFRQLNKDIYIDKGVEVKRSKDEQNL